MALVNEIVACSLVDSPSCLLAPKTFLGNNVIQKRQTNPNQRRDFIYLRKKVMRRPMTVISDYLVNKVVPPPLETYEKPVKYNVRALVTVRNKHKEDLKSILVNKLDSLAEIIGMNIILELVSTDVDPKTKAAKRSNVAVLKDWHKKSTVKGESVQYTAEFCVNSNFGLPGAILVTNKHQKEFFLESITIEGFPSGPVHFPCNSWVQPKKIHPNKRIFFSNMPYLPHETPEGLKSLREEELKNLRGDGRGVRKMTDRIYDFDVYNDLGNPDKGIDYVRPTLGGEKIPYPRRCRTGRPSTNTNVTIESRVEAPHPIYVPRDEQFEELKLHTVKFNRFKGLVHNFLPALKATMITKKNDFNKFSDLDNLYNEGAYLQAELDKLLLKKVVVPKTVTKVQETSQGILKYDTPLIVAKDKFAWFRDDEFARQAIAGINPCSIERLKVFPPKSKLDPEIYGPQDSALREEHILGYLGGMSVQEALEQNKLFIIDYHDTYIPFLDRINALDGRKAYATRTIFFKTSLGTLKPIAIELSLPCSGSNSQPKSVVTPPVDATTSWTWMLAKAHVTSNDSSIHQLVHHWLCTHACIEPFILAAHRQLSAMHPILKLLDPHMRYTLDINALARKKLIHAEGVIESCFTPGRYAMEISAAAYKTWRFDRESLHAKLIDRGMAEPDPTQPFGLKLVLEDYPYANDGLLIWSAIEKWVQRYVNHYYPHDSLICHDHELQSWYIEAICVGHADKRNETWWPQLYNADNLVFVLTTLIWNASAQHAALNFAQYPLGGYLPSRSPLMRRLIPDENDSEYASFHADPQKYFLSALPSVLQATKFMAVIDTLSTHSPDEEYLGERPHPSIWTGDSKIIKAFYEFSSEIQQIEKEIERRNKDPSLRNRCGAGVLPYELLAPSSKPGVTCRGIPNSITI